jgi:L-xylulokinase
VQQFFPDLPDSYRQLNQWAKDGYEKDLNILFYPWLYGSNFHDSLHGGFLGLSGHHSREDIIYAIYQGIVFSHLLHQDRVQDLGTGSDFIRFTGGPTHSDIWMQMFCDASNLPLEIVDVKQSGCRAAAICAAVGAGEYSDFQTAMKHCQPPTLRLEPNPAKHVMLRKRFERFKRLRRH